MDINFPGPSADSDSFLSIHKGRFNPILIQSVARQRKLAQRSTVPLGRAYADRPPGAIHAGEGNQDSKRFFGRPRDGSNWTFDGVDATGIKTPAGRQPESRDFTPLTAHGELGGAAQNAQNN